ncbi:helix-turn-helix domain-containing protein [Saccharopolyspora griseoalba]|uniref:Helix-turn-helix domain-containing protein n=1 Tax=Saccharopolyspora griseoalba TaxID=1431848 RepID=A0ABW2LER5_9PSEU
MDIDEHAQVAHLDPKRLRALAHPLRLQLLGALRTEGAATATSLAKRFGHNSANTSWHLRQLAEAGLVTEDLGRGNRRERWWTAAHDYTHADVIELGRDPALLDALATYLHGINAIHHQQASTYLAEMDRWSETWRGAAELSDHRLTLTAEEATQLNDRINEVIADYRRTRQPGDTDVVVQWHLLPQHPGDEETP